MKNVFSPDTTTELVQRINKLTPETNPLWGKMSVSQMLAHCNVAYEMVYDDKHPKPGAIKKIILKTFIKPLVVNEKPYKKGSPTSSEFKVSDDKNFDAEKSRLIHHIQKTQELGEAYFEGKDSHSFGNLTSKEWNNMFYKHLNHHLNQFGV